MLEVTLQWTSIPEEILLVASSYWDQDKPDIPIVSYADFTFTYVFNCIKDKETIVSSWGYMYLFQIEFKLVVKNQGLWF